MVTNTLAYTVALPLILVSSVVVQAADQVRFGTFPSYGKNAGLVWAKSASYFSKQDIDFSLVDSRVSTAVLLEGRNVDIAQILCSSVGDLVSNGANLEIIAVRDQRNPIAIVSLDDAGIQSPDDLSNKRWGYSASFSPEQNIFREAGRRMGFDFNTIEKISLDFSLRLPSLLNGDVDFISAWIGSVLPIYQKAIDDSGRKIRVLRWEDFGIDIYGECFIARSDWLKENANLTERWLTAAEEGFQHVLDYPEDGIEAIIGYYGLEAGDPDVIRLAVHQSNELLEHDGRQGIFSIERDKLHDTLIMLGVTADREDLDRLIWQKANIID